MPLLNYTTKVPVANTVRDLTALLVKAGASKIMNDYDSDGVVSSMSFRVPMDGNFIDFVLPIDWKSVQQVLRNDGVRNDDAHAQRVAWRIMKDWVEAQMALLATKSVTLPQVFLPYAVNKQGVTLYQMVAENPSMLLGDGNG